MRTVGIIAEYNPFHEGHAYHIAKAKEITESDYAAVIMNGDFVQRGEPAIFNKYVRTQMALDGGADFVFELPVRFGVSSAGDFAYGGVLALRALGFINSLCFGSESGDLDSILDIARVLASEPDDFKFYLTAGLKEGLSYPAAQSKALERVSGTKLDVSILESPNNILGIEYCIALNKLKSHIQPYTIKRNGTAYNSDSINTKQYPSALAVRKKIMQKDIKHLELDDFSSVLGYSLLASDKLTAYKDISDDLSNRIKSFLIDYQSFSHLVDECHTRAFTEGRIRRGLLQCLLNITQTPLNMPYLRLLGMKKRASHLLGDMVDSCQLIGRLSVDLRKLSTDERELLAQDVFASELYRQTWCRKYYDRLPNEFQRSPIVVD